MIRIGAYSLLFVAPTLAGCIQRGEPTLGDFLETVKTKRFIDLTHAFEPGIPHWPGFPDERRETLYGYDEGEGIMDKGFLAQRYTLVGQWGTHCDPPAHFAKGKRTIDEIDPKEMLLPLVVAVLGGSSNRRKIQAISFALTYKRCVSGSKAAP